jgi:hypothetical protein
MLNNRPKKLGIIDYVSGGTGKLTGKELGFYRFRKIILVFTGTFNTAGAASFGTLATEAPFNILRDIRWNGKSLVQKTGGRWLRQLNLYLRGYDASFSAPTATNTNQTIAFTLYLDHEMLGTDANDVSIQDISRNVANPSLELDFGTVEHLIAGGDYTTKTITGATVTVFGELAESKALKNLAFSSRELNYIEKPISSSAQTEYPVSLPLSRSITRILLGQFTDAPEVLIATLVAASANIRIDVNGKPWWGPFTFQEIQRENLAKARVALNSGYVVLDFLQKGRLADWLDLTNTLDRRDSDRVTSAELVVDVSSVASAKLGLLVESLVPPHLQKAA